MIRLNGFFQVKAGVSEAQLKALTDELVEKSLSDEGNHGYDLFHSSTRPDVYLFCETWESAEALNAHMHTDHFTTLVGAIEKEAAMSLEQMELKK